MNCNEQVLLYTAGELNAQQKQVFETHLKTCEKCQAALRFATQVQENLTAPAAPANLVDRVFAKTSRRKKAYWLWGWKPLLTGAAMLGMGLLSFNLLTRTDKSTLGGDDIVAYMSENLDEDYQAFENDLDLFEGYF